MWVLAFVALSVGILVYKSVRFSRRRNLDRRHPRLNVHPDPLMWAVVREAITTKKIVVGRIDENGNLEMRVGDDIHKVIRVDEV